jgi:hypothetical protein
MYTWSQLSRWTISNYWYIGEKGARVHLATMTRDWLGKKSQHIVHLSYKELSPLMPNDITEEERLMQQLLVAKQIVHELGVCC